MTNSRNLLIALAVVVSSIGFSGPASAQLLGMYGGENLELTGASGGRLGSVTSSNIVDGAITLRQVIKWRNRVDGIRTLTGKGRPEELDAESAALIDLMNATVELAKEKKYNEALVSLRKFEERASKNPEEVFFIQRMRASIAYESGKETLFAKSLEAAIATNQAPAEEQLQFIQLLSSLYAKQKDLPKTIAWTSRYIKEGGAEPGMRTRLIRAHYLNNDFAEAARELRENIAADQAAGRTPAQEDLGLLASAELKAGNQTGHDGPIEK